MYFRTFLYLLFDLLLRDSSSMLTDGPGVYMVANANYCAEAHMRQRE